jgi:hypothetical protein
MKLPQVSLRELFLLVVIAAMGCGWWVDRSRTQKERDRLYLWPKERGDKLRVWVDENGAEQLELEGGGRIVIPARSW